MYSGKNVGHFLSKTAYAPFQLLIMPVYLVRMLTSNKRLNMTYRENNRRSEGNRYKG